MFCSKFAASESKNDRRPVHGGMIGPRAALMQFDNVNAQSRLAIHRSGVSNPLDVGRIRDDDDAVMNRITNIKQHPLPRASSF